MSVLCSPVSGLPGTVGSSSSRSTSCCTSPTPRGFARSFTDDAVEKRRQSNPLHEPRQKKDIYERSNQQQGERRLQLLKREIAEKKADQQKRVAEQLVRSLSLRQAATSAPVTPPPQERRSNLKKKPVPAPLKPASVPFSFENLMATPEIFSTSSSPDEAFPDPDPTSPATAKAGLNPRAKRLADERNKRKREKMGDDVKQAVDEPQLKRPTLQEKRALWKQRKGAVPELASLSEAAPLPCTQLPDDVDEIDDVIRSRLSEGRKDAPLHWTEAQKTNFASLLEKAKKQRSPREGDMPMEG
eukprot:TRINITY_DN72944_c0_g1_i1.p1 TRINITY_DN72944_c0_g1~~TRINITY_DN72944_c0_g1_i1.p1  ORF type:complete len:300 (+),score=111.34 TRINITY_DN72944_c0_g1_i1:39-938(+)